MNIRAIRGQKEVFMKNSKRIKWPSISLIFALCAGIGYTGNYPSDGDAADYDDDGCPASGGDTGCIEFQFSIGPMKNHIEVPAGKLWVMSELPSPVVSTPQAIKVITGLYGIHRAVGREVDVIDLKGRKITFIFPEGAAEASPSGQNSTLHLSLKTVDLHGVPTTNSPVYYDLYTFKDLERVRFDADTNSVNYLRLVNLRTRTGQIYESSEFGMDCIYDEEGSVRQVMAPSRFLDLVTFDEFKYEVRMYDPHDVSSGVNINGLYEPLTGAEPFEIWTVENPNRENSIYEINVSRTVGGTARTMAFTYTEPQNTWAMTRDDGETFNQSTMEWDDSQVDCVRTKSFYSAGEAPVQKTIKRLTKQSWGQALMEVEELVSATNSRTMTLTYYIDESQTGRYSRIESRLNADGSWEWFDYDEKGRCTVAVYPWKNETLTTNAALAKAIYYDYSPHEAADVPMEFDERPRTIIETVSGIITKKTLHAYKTNSIGAQMHIVEQYDSQNSSYGDAANFRMTETYYPPCGDGGSFQDRLSQGRLRTVEYSDGRFQTYEYALGDLVIDSTYPENSLFTVNTNGLAWRISTINGTTSHPTGIAGKTTKQTVVKDRLGNDALTEAYIYTGSGYERVDWTVKQFDIHGNNIEAWYSDGTVKSGSWGTGCCGKESSTERDGTQFVYTYDLNGRKISESRLDTNGIAGFTIEFSYDAAGRQISTKKYAPGIDPLRTETDLDMIGRPLRHVLEDGTVKIWSYDDSARIVTAQRPGGATAVTERFLDGRVRSRTGTAEVNKTYDYGVNSDGTVWGTEYTGSGGTNSPMWKKKTENFFGRLFNIESPACGGGTLVSQTFFGPEGRGEKIIQSAVNGAVASVIETTFYDYNELGEEIRRATDLDADGQLNLAVDRVAEVETRYQKIGNDWWSVSENRIYPEDGNSTAFTTAVQRIRLTGLGSQSTLGKLTSESVVIDPFNNQVVSRKFTNRDNKTVTVVTDVPDSDMDEVVVTINRMKAYEISKTGVRVDYEYDSLTRQIGSRSESGGGTRSVSSRISYNDKGQVAWREDEASNRTWFGYDQDTGLRVAATNALGHTTLYTYNLRGEITLVGGSSQYPVEYRYDDYGRRTDLFTLRGATNGWDRTQWFYDAATGLVTNKLYADGNGPSYTYTPEGKLATRTWARGTTTTYSYDSIGQLTNTVYSDSTPSVSMAYNRLGQKTQIIDASGTNTFAYNSMLQLTNEFNVGKASSLSRLYDDLGRSAGMTLGDDYAVSYSYDDLGRFSSVSSLVSSVTSMFEYSRLEGSSLISGYTNSHGLAVSYDFEENRNAKTQVLNEFGTNFVSRFDYTYDALMRRAERVDLRPSDLGPSTNSFVYNARSELVGADMGADQYGYAYDSIGNREWARMNANTNRYVANNLNQYSQITNNQSQITLSYDPDGNLLSDGVSTYSWNGENRLIQVSNATTVVTYVYDHQGRMFEKKVNGTTTRFAWSGLNILAEISEASTHLNVWGLGSSGGVGGLLSVTVLTNSTASTYFPTYDANGNITEYVTTNGTTAAHYEYDPYGNITFTSGPRSGIFSHRYSTKPFEVETGLIHYELRAYSPHFGRFISCDPVKEAGGLNLYVFCRNSPASLIDSLGLAPCGEEKERDWDKWNADREARQELEWQQHLLELDKQDLEVAMAEFPEEFMDGKADQIIEQIDKAIAQLQVMKDAATLTVYADKAASGSGSSGSAGSSFGHGWVEITYSNGSSVTVGNYPGGWRDSDSATSSTASTSFEVTGLQAAVIYLGVTKPGYDFFTDNCVDRVEFALSVAGIEHPSFNTFGVSNPAKLYDWIDSVNSNK